MARGSRTSRRFPPSLPALSAVVIGAAVFIAAVPIAVSDVLLLSGNSVMERLQDEQAVDRASLNRFVRSREAAANWRRTARIHTDLALGLLILGEYEDAGRGHGPGEVETVLEKGLGLAAMDPYGWMRLVQVRLDREAPASEIAAPLRLALHTGPHEDRRHAMLLLMVEAGLGVWDELDESGRVLIAEKARAAFGRDIRGASAAAVRAGRPEVLGEILGF